MSDGAAHYSGERLMAVASLPGIGALSCELGAANTDAAASEIMLLPAGPDINTRVHDGRKFKLTSAAKVIKATQPLLPFVIDYEHQSVHAAKNGQPAPAAGWVQTLLEKEGAIYATVKWTERAAAMLKAGEYRFISPVFQLDKKTGEVLRLTAAALVADPAISMPALAAAQAEQENTPMDFQMSVIKLLSLPENTDASDVLAAIKALQQQVSQNTDTDAIAATANTPAQLVTQLGQLEKQVKQLASASQKATATNCVDAAISSGKLTPAQREWALTYAAAEPAAFAQFVANQPPILVSSSAAAQPTVSAPLTSAEQQVCQAMGLTAEQWQTHNKQEQSL